MRKLTTVLLVSAMAGSLLLAGCGANDEPVADAGDTPPALQEEYRFVMIPILAQAWFDIVYEASERAAERLEEQLGVSIEIDYQAPPEADIVAQNEYIERAIATNPDGIAINAVDVEAQHELFLEAKEQGIPVMLFADFPIDEEAIPHVGNDFYEQGYTAGRELLERIDYQGKVAIIHGVEGSSPHAARVQAYEDLFEQYDDVEVVAKVFDYDDIEIAHREASAILSAHPDLAGFALADAAGPVGAGLAIQEAGLVGEVQYVGIDDLPQLQELMLDGVLDLSIATRPNHIGEWVTMSLFAENLGFEPIPFLDTKWARLTPEIAADPDFTGF